MPNFSRITLIFNTDLQVNQNFGFTAQSLIPSYIGYRVSSVRFQPGIVEFASNPTVLPGERTAINFVSAFLLDWANVGPYSITRNQNVVDIYATVENIDFTNVFSFDNFLEIPAVSNSDVEFSINNFSGNLFTITSVEIVEASSNPVCTHYDVRVTTSETFDTIIIETSDGDTIVENNTDNPFVFSVKRDQRFRFQCSLITGQSDSYTHLPGSIPRTMTDEINVEIANSPMGATITVLYLAIQSPTLEYSLDGVNYQTSNVFTGISDGDYTIRVRHLGCIVNKQITVENLTGISNPFRYISNSMSIRFAFRENSNQCTRILKDENTLSNEFYAIDPDLAYCEKQLFQTCDSIKTQVKSNYENVSAQVIKQDGSRDNLTVVKLTNFIGIKDSRDAIKYDLGNGEAGVYFTTGNIYEYDTNLDTGEDYILNGGLPEYALVGNWISIESAYFQIKSIIFDEDKNSDVLVIDEVFSGEENVVVKSVFNREKYEVFEFTTDMSSYENSIIQIEVLMSDTRFENALFLSEKIHVKEEHKNTIVVDYYNTSNTDVFYATGIKNRVRLPVLSIAANHVDEFENLKGDSFSNIIKSSVYELYKFQLGLFTTGMYRKIVEVFSHKFIFISGISFIKNASIEVEGPLEDSNLYIVSPEMLKTNKPFVIGIIEVSPENSFAESAIEVPRAIIDEEGNPIVHS